MIHFDKAFALESQKLGLGEDSSLQLVSHAHTDHIARSSYPFVCSDFTAKMISYRLKRSIQVANHPSVKLLDAGHILGSNMFLIKDSFLYTGDFNTQKSMVGKAEPVKCKTLVIETTYGSPEYIFPNKEEVLDSLSEYLTHHPKAVISCSDRSFGKVQEVCMELDRMKVPFRIDQDIKEVNNHLNLSFKEESEDANIWVSNKRYALMFPPEYKRVHLSGWTLRENDPMVDKSFVYSGHADYFSLLSFVEGCDPDEVYTTHDFEEEFARDLRGRGYRAQPLSNLTGNSKKTQQSLGQFF